MTAWSINSPTQAFGGKDGLQAFTAIGVVRAGEPYRADMGCGFEPYRRDVAWFDAKTTAIKPLLDRLALTHGQRNWGYQFRFGLLALSADDFTFIASAMKAGQNMLAAAS